MKKKEPTPFLQNEEKGTDPFSSFYYSILVCFIFPL